MLILCVLILSPVADGISIKLNMKGEKMFTAIIENEGNTLVMEFPCKRYLMADHLGSIGIRKPAHEIKCVDEEDEPIKVKIFGNSEFEKRLALLISPTDTLSLVNTMCEFYQNLPYQNRLDAMEAVMSGKVSSIAEFDKFMFESRMEDTTEYFYCPLVANVYSRDEYGNMEDYTDEYDGSYLAPYEERIRELIRLEDARDEDNLAAYFDGSNGAVGKLKEVHLLCYRNTLQRGLPHSPLCPSLQRSYRLSLGSDGKRSVSVQILGYLPAYRRIRQACL